MKLQFPDLRGMSPAQKNDEIIALRKFYEKTVMQKPSKFLLKFWSFIDRVFRWKVMLIKVRNPLLSGKTVLTDNEKKNEYIYFQEVTDSPCYSFEDLLNHVLIRVNRHVLSVAGVPAEGYVFRTENGTYEIHIKDFKTN